LCPLSAGRLDAGARQTRRAQARLLDCTRLNKRPGGGGSRKRDGLPYFLRIGSVIAIVHRRGDGGAGHPHIVARRRTRRVLRRIGRAIGTLILLQAGIWSSRKRVATRTARRLRLHFSNGLFERKPLARYVRLAERRLNAA
jgi:hypothetical protein